jgi:hypothetical protein
VDASVSRGSVAVMDNNSREAVPESRESPSAVAAWLSRNAGSYSEIGLPSQRTIA